MGCFVWDREGRIEAGAPFGEGIYFILDLKPFLRRFGTTDTMSKTLVWLPDWHQALWICELLDIEDDAITSVSVGINPTDAGEILLGLYNLILMALERTKELHAPVEDQAKSLLHGACGPLDDIEVCSQDWKNWETNYKPSFHHENWLFWQHSMKGNHMPASLPLQQQTI